MRPGFLFGGDQEQETESVVLIIVVLAMICAAFVTAFMRVFSRKYKANVPGFFTTYGYGVVTFAAAAFVVFVVQQPEPHYTVFSVFLAAIFHGFNMAGRLFAYIAVRYEKPQLLGVLQYFQILLVVLGEILFLGFKLQLLDILGIVCIFCASIGLTIYNLKKNR